MLKPNASAMQVQIRGDDYQLDQLQVIQRLGDLPQVKFCFLDDDPHICKLRLWRDSQVEATVAGLVVHIDDVVPNQQSRSAWCVVATAGSRELSGWLQAHPNAAAGRVLVYQRAESESAASSFVNRTTGNRFLDFPPSVNLEAVFARESVIVRPGGLNNRHYVDLLTEIMRMHYPNVVGWTAFHRSQQPLALVTTDWPSVRALDDEWDWVPASPTRAEKESVRLYRRYVTCENQSDLHRFFHDLCKYGRAPLGLNTVPAPGTVRLGSRLELCRQVVHTFRYDTLEVRVDVEVVDKLSAPRAYYAGLGTCEGKFVEWASSEKESDRKWLAKLKPSDGRWVMMSDELHESIDDSGLLRTWLLTPADVGWSNPTAGTETADVPTDRGLYIRHPVNVVKKVSLYQGCQPGALGEIQKFDIESEKRAISVIGEEVDIRTTAEGATASSGVTVNKQQVRAQVGKDSFLEIANDQTRVAQLQVDKMLKVDP